jgi:hypothetical protein
VTEWAQRILPLKSAMISEDASSIEEAFRSKMAAIEVELMSDEHSVGQPELEATRLTRSLAARNEKSVRGKRRSRPSADRVSIHLPESAEPVAHGRATPQAPVDKSKLALNEPRRYRNRAHLELVASQPCLICERRPSDAHHLRFAQPSALGRRVSDEFTVPLCRSYHRALHRRGDEAEWWRENGIDPVGIAQKLWERARLGNLAATRAVPFPPI